jgi:hypothetical protein
VFLGLVCLFTQVSLNTGKKAERLASINALWVIYVE